MFEIYDFYKFLDEKEQDRIRELEPFLSDTPEDVDIFISDRMEEKTKPTEMGSQFTKAASDFIEEKTEPTFDWKEFGEDALSSIEPGGGAPQALGSTPPKFGPSAPLGRSRFTPVQEPIQYGILPEVLTNMQLRILAEDYLKDLYRQARNSIRQPNIRTLV